MNDNLQHFQPDPELDALLDDALSANGVEMPAGMTDRIVAATMPLLAASRPAVVGRIDGYSTSFIMRIAAGLLVAASVGVAIIASNLRTDVTGDEAARLAAAEQSNKQATLLVALGTDLEAARVTGSDTFALADTSVDQTIDQLKARASEIDAGVEQWSSVAESLESELNDMDSDNG